MSKIQKIYFKDMGHSQGLKVIDLQVSFEKA